MSVVHVALLVEEPSMAEALQQLLPKILGDVSFEVHPHQSKHDLLARLRSTLRGYSSWLPQDWRIVVVIDRDNDDCHELKARLEDLAAAAQLTSRTAANGNHWVLVNRLAIEELEAWYFGDWDAVRAVYPRVPATIPAQARYRTPDAIRGGTWEAFEQVLQRAGYFVGGLRKIEAARMISAQIVPDRNSSPSFAALRDVLAGLTEA